MEIRKKVLCAAGGILTALFLLASPAFAMTATTNVGTYVYIRSRATQNSPQLGILIPGQTVEVIGRVGGWTKVQRGSVTGYIKSSLLTTVGAAGSSAGGSSYGTQTGSAGTSVSGTGSAAYGALTAASGYVTPRGKQNVNIRYSASTRTARISVLIHGRTAQVLGKQGGWYQVTANGVTGFVRADVVRLTNSPSSGTGTGTGYTQTNAGTGSSAGNTQTSAGTGSGAGNTQTNTGTGNGSGNDAAGTGTGTGEETPADGNGSENAGNTPSVEDQIPEEDISSVNPSGSQGGNNSGSEQQEEGNTSSSSGSQGENGSPDSSQEQGNTGSDSSSSSQEQGNTGSDSSSSSQEQGSTGNGSSSSSEGQNGDAESTSSSSESGGNAADGQNEGNTGDASGQPGTGSNPPLVAETVDLIPEEEYDGDLIEVGDIGIVTTQLLPVRTAPNGAAKKLGYEVCDAKVAVLGIEDGFFKISFYGNIGYIDSDYVSFDTARYPDLTKDEPDYSPVTGDNVRYNATETEIRMMAAIVQREVGGCSRECKIAVASVILNQVDSDLFPDTVTRVLASSGWGKKGVGTKYYQIYYSQEGPTAGCVEAVRAALAGENPVEDMVAFHAKQGGDGIYIDDIRFYK